MFTSKAAVPVMAIFVVLVFRPSRNLVLGVGSLIPRLKIQSPPCPPAGMFLERETDPQRGRAVSVPQAFLALPTLRNQGIRIRYRFRWTAPRWNAYTSDDGPSTTPA